MLYFHATDHGSTEKRMFGQDQLTISTIDLVDYKIDEIELKEKLDKIKTRKTIVLADTCYSGAFAYRFSQGNYIGIASCEEHKKVWKSDKDTFSRKFLEAFRTYDADKNKDGTISANEAFEYGKKNHLWMKIYDYNPQMKSELNLDDDLFE